MTLLSSRKILPQRTVLTVLKIKLLSSRKILPQRTVLTVLKIKYGLSFHKKHTVHAH